MKEKVKKSIALLTAFIFAFTGAFMFNGLSNMAYADVSSVSDDQDVTYSTSGGVFGSLGIDTSEMPATYNADSTSNPYGSDVTTMYEMNELVKLDTSSNDNTVAASLYGDNAKLDGSYDTMMGASKDSSFEGPHKNGFYSVTDVDVNGAGRDSGAAMVYTNYRHYTEGQTEPDHKIYMKIFNPKTGEATEPFEISSLIENRLMFSYEIMSQLQITAGDFDNDRVDEIAVYVPASVDGAHNKVAIYDLTNGTECANPYNKAAWQNAWNYVLPKSSAQVFEYEPLHPEGQNKYYLTNFYNNLDLAAGDADNDGACDLVISYGASDVSRTARYKKTVYRSLPSTSVVLYGSNGTPNRGGQMLRQAQTLSYGDDPLIRVSFAFGDLDGDGNEEMVLGGQRQSEQDNNISRVLGKYIYDNDAGGMVLETSNNLNIVSGSWSENDSGEKTFASSNGWDGEYYSIPAMKTNLAVGSIMGQSSSTRIYMDSCLYSYDGTFALVDELEDNSPEDPDKPDGKRKGSALFTDIKGFGSFESQQWEYFEYGASVGNYTRSEGDYVIVHRFSTERRNGGLEECVIADAGMIVPVENDEGELELTKESNKSKIHSGAIGSPITLFSSDTDIDSAVYHYTGKHEIEYTKPRVLAVLASAPYYKDVANYDSGYLPFCETTYGESAGNSREHTSSLEFTIGAYTNHAFKAGAITIFAVDLVGFEFSSSLGYKYTKEATKSVTNTFDVTYGTAAGENEVVLFSTPVEKFEYQVTTAAVDEDGNVRTSTSTDIQAKAHQPVTVTMPLEDYMEIQKQEGYSEILPDVSKYITSKPGYPETYPSGKSDLPKEVAEGWKKYGKTDEYAEYEDMADPDSNDPDVVTRDEYLTYRKDAWEGAGYGEGFIEQTISRETDSTHGSTNGVYWDFGIGAKWEQEETAGLGWEYEGGVGVKVGVTSGSGMTYGAPKGISFSGQVANMPRSAKPYGYYFSWTLMKYMVYDSADYAFPVISYLVKDTDTAPPKLPETVMQDFDDTTDSQIGLTWNYSGTEACEFDIYRYKDFPQGGGDELVGTVRGSDYKILKDENNNTITDSNGKTIREYSFVEEGLTADTKYNYRMKVKADNNPKESIFSPVIQARTDVSEKPVVNLSADSLKIYPDDQSTVSVNLENPDQYETGIDYQWQKYNSKTRTWEDLDGRTNRTALFSDCKKEDEGQYRCRVNCVRKRESAPQYISCFTDTCTVTYSKHNVVFGPISVFDGEGRSYVNTGLEVKVSNESQTGTAKPTRTVTFTINGPNGEMSVYATVDPKTGIARINSLEDLISSLGNEAFVDGGYLITASYEGDDIFYSAEDPEEYHYLRNIDECTWLSTQSGYLFGQDIMPTSNLYDYKKQPDGTVLRTDITDQITRVKIFAADENGQKTGDAVEDYALADTNGTAKIPLYEKLKKRAWIEVYTDNDTEAAGHQVIRTAPMTVDISLSGKYSGCGDLFKPYTFDGDDVSISGDGSLTEKNMVPADGGDPKSLEDLLKFRYYEASGEKMFDSTDLEEHPEYRDEFVPAIYRVGVLAKSTADRKFLETFYRFGSNARADFLVVGSYYEVTASPSDENAGTVRMISPILEDEVDKIGFSGGSKITLKALPARGFRIKNWKIEDGQGGIKYQNGGELLTYTLRSDPTINSNGQVVITAVFEPKNNTLTYEKKGEGTLTVNPAFVSGNTVLEGMEMQFMARAAEGWHFKEWRWTDYGGNSTIAAGTPDTSGINSKTFTMGANPANVCAIFFRDTIDLDVQGKLKVSYINDGSNPVEDTGKEIIVDNGKTVPKGTKVKVKTAPGFVLADDAEWTVTATTPDGTSQLEIEEFIDGTSEGCTFTLPSDVTACSVATSTEKGLYTVGIGGENVTYVVKLDGREIPADQYEEKLQRITAGTYVEIQALPKRGKLFDDWIVDGERQKSSEKTYSCTLMDSMVIEAAVKDDTPHDVKLQTTGGGTGVLTITDHNGNQIKRNFGADQMQIQGFDGESLSISESPDDPAHIMTEVKMNGKRQDLQDGVFSLESITEDLEFVCGFQPSTFCVVSIVSEVQDAEPVVLDSEGRQMDPGETIQVGGGTDVPFTVVLDKRYPCNVRDGDALLTPVSTEEDGDNIKYNYKLENVTQNVMLTIDDRSEYTISNWDEFTAFINKVNTISTSGSKERPQGKVTADIEMPTGASVPQATGTFTGTLDGQGHIISGLRLDGNGHSCIFEEIAEGACVKNLIIEDFEAAVPQAYVPHSDTGAGNALLARINYGTISGVTLKNCTLKEIIYDLDNSLDGPQLAGIAAYNAGTVEGCQVIGLKVAGQRPYPSGENEVGCAGVLYNHTKNGGTVEKQGAVTGCYFEGLQYSDTENDNYQAAGINIISADLHDLGAGPFTGNYYRGPEGARETSEHGANVTSITDSSDWTQAEEEISQPAFAAKLAYFLNKESKVKTKLWGIEQPTDAQSGGGTVTPQIIPLSCGSETCKAPVKAQFTYSAKEVDLSLYMYPGQYGLPGADSLGDKTPNYWQCGGKAYSAGFGPIEITEDIKFTGIDSLANCVATLSSAQGEGTICFQDLNAALDAAEATTQDAPLLTIVGDCTMENKTFTIPENMCMTIADGAELTIKKTATISNKGEFTLESGSTLHKNGAIDNSGTIKVGGTFYNYGSRLNNKKGTIENQKDIICKPHRMGEWKPADQPNADGTWTKTSVCEVCTNDESIEVQPNPDAQNIDSMEIFKSADKGEYTVTEPFETEGMIVAATLKDGGRAVILDKNKDASGKGYDMTYEDESGQTRTINDGYVLNEPGSMQISVNYGGFTSTFLINVYSGLTELQIAEGSKDVAKGGKLQLKAVLTPADAPAKVSWMSSDESVATVDENGLVKALSPGRTLITVSADDLSATCLVKVIDGTVTLDLDQDSLLIPKDGNSLLAARVSPTTSPAAGGTIEWTVADASVAGFCVTDEATGAVTVKDAMTTQLSPGDATVSSAYAPITGVGEGETVITASIADDRGLVITKECKVEVQDAIASITMKYDGADVSGATVPADLWMESIQFTAESSEPGDTVQWLTIDDDADPVISVDQSGKVTLNRTGTAAVSAVSAKTGVSDVCLVKVGDEPQPITEISIADGGREVEKDGTLQLQAIVVPEGAKTPITWASSDESVATVDENGRVKGVSPGQAMITATASGMTASCIIKVPERAETLQLDQLDMQLMENGAGLLTARVSPGTAEGVITWTVEDSSVAGFYETDETGQTKVTDTVKTPLTPNAAAAETSAYVTVAGITEGETIIAASITDPQGRVMRQDCKITVEKAPVTVTMLYEGQPVSGATLTLDASLEEVQFEAESSDPDDVLKWAAVDDDADPVISIDQTGKVKLLRSGTAVVSVISEKNGVSDICVLKVVKKAKSIKISSDKLRFAIGTVKMLTAALDPEDADGGIVWTSSNEQAAKVSGSGVVTGVGEGTAVITAASGSDDSIKATCTVTVFDPNLTMTISHEKFYYDGKEHYPAVTVRSGKAVLAEKATTSNNDVLILYSGGRTLPGKYNVTATGREEGMGTAEASYKIIVKPTAIKKIKRDETSFTVNWKKPGAQYITGYQLRYSLKENMKKSKYKTIGKQSTTKLTVKKLNEKKRYYVQIRTYKTINGKKYYSAWSETKKASPPIKIKLDKKTVYYLGKPRTPLVTAKSGDTVLASRLNVSNENVNIVYSGKHLLPGKYQVKVSSVDDESMKSAKANFRIIIKPTKIKKAKRIKQGFTIRWKKPAKKFITGYQVRYSVNKNMSKSKVKKIKKQSTTKLTVKDLIAKKTYYVQIRTYKTIKGKRYYSKWSKAMKIRTK